MTNKATALHCLIFNVRFGLLRSMDIGEQVPSPAACVEIRSLRLQKQSCLTAFPHATRSPLVYKICVPCLLWIKNVSSLEMRMYKLLPHPLSPSLISETTRSTGGPRKTSIPVHTAQPSGVSKFDSTHLFRQNLILTSRMSPHCGEFQNCQIQRSVCVPAVAHNAPQKRTG